MRTSAPLGGRAAWGESGCSVSSVLRERRVWAECEWTHDCECARGACKASVCARPWAPPPPTPWSYLIGLWPYAPRGRPEMKSSPPAKPPSSGALCSEAPLAAATPRSRSRSYRARRSEVMNWSDRRGRASPGPLIIEAILIWARSWGTAASGTGAKRLLSAAAGALTRFRKVQVKEMSAHPLELEAHEALFAAAVFVF